MRKKARPSAAAGAATLAMALGMPLAASAAVSNLPLPTEPVHYQMETVLQDLQQPGAFEGNLSLVVYPSGIVSGFYLPQDSRSRDVTGGTDGQNIWLDIGGIHPMHLTGTLRNGELKTIVSVPGPDTVVFESTKSVKMRT